MPAPPDTAVEQPRGGQRAPAEPRTSRWLAVLAPAACGRPRAARRPDLRGRLSVPRRRSAPSPRRLVVAAHADGDGHPARMRRRAAAGAGAAAREPRVVARHPRDRRLAAGALRVEGRRAEVAAARLHGRLRRHAVHRARAQARCTAGRPSGGRCAARRRERRRVSGRDDRCRAAAAAVPRQPAAGRDLDRHVAVQPIALRYADRGAAFSAAPLYLGETSLLRIGLAGRAAPMGSWPTSPRCRR